ncbi:hypothetical protein C0992_000982 [Termitomyces sp. T32_za158]|nr:hypothetical protein C0992_000982 [Termitomyces sp. T32_za158]
MKYSWPQPPPFTWPSITPRQPLRIFPPPEPLSLPPLPSPARKPTFDALYTLSTHMFPAAYLRTTEYVQPPSPLAASATKAERQAHASDVLQKLKDLRGSLVPRGAKQVLWNCVNRYVRVGLDEKQASGVTLLFAHANGFPKEIWEPTLQHLFSSPAVSVIDEVWTWESVQHGDACLINGDKNGGVWTRLFMLFVSPLFSVPDPAALKVYIECGTYDTRDPVTGEPIIRLKMPGIQEAIVFSETHTEFEVFQQLPTLDERIELRWIVPGKPGAEE